jgi:hypothetical protein
MSECKGNSSDGGFLFFLFLMWFIFHGGCQLPEEFKKVREQLERIESKVDALD